MVAHLSRGIDVLTDRYYLSSFAYQGMSLDWDQTGVVTINTKRAQVSLDGIWRFIPAAEGTVTFLTVTLAFLIGLRF